MPDILKQYFDIIGIPQWITITICLWIAVLILWFKVFLPIYRKWKTKEKIEDIEIQGKKQKLSSKKKADEKIEKNEKTKELSFWENYKQNPYLNTSVIIITFFLFFIPAWVIAHNKDKLTPTSNDKIGIWIARFKNDKYNTCNSMITHLNDFTFVEDSNKIFEVRDLQKEIPGDDIKIQFSKAENEGREVNATLVVFGNIIDSGENNSSVCYWYIAFPKNQEGLSLPNKDCTGKFKLGELTQISGIPIDIKNISVICEIIQGIAFYKNGDYSKAKEIFIKIYDNEKEFKEKKIPISWNIIYFYLANCYIQDIGACSYQEALKYFNMTLKIDPNDDYALNNKAGILCFLGGYKEAIDCCNKAIKLNPKNELVLNTKGVILNVQGKHEEAIKCFDKVLNLKPDDDTVWNNKGNTLYTQKKYKEAIKCFDKAIELNPTNESAWSNKALISHEQGKYNEAIQYCDKAIKLNSKYDAAWSNKGMVLDKLARYEEAIQCFNKALELNMNNQYTWNNKGLTLYNQGKYEEALQYYSTAIKLNPRYDAPWYNKGLILYNQHNYNEALTCFDKATEINPTNELAWNDKGVIFGILSKYEEAIKCFNVVLEINPNNKSAQSNREKALSLNKK